MNEKAYFAAGCFWGVEDRFRKTPGVIDAVSGYMGGHTEHPTYRDVCSGGTGHTETVEVTFDPTRVSYDQLLDTFFGMHNPTTLNRQGPDFGSQYRSAIFSVDSKQREKSEHKIAALNAAGRWRDPIVTEVNEGATFWPAEEYHQRYFEKNGGGYCKA
ncbi:MAG: peptide-methionine (S)-S-oxide reductase MsrA [Xanthomonadales bacterium]|nr:peptide-methionine (S)-S-oxide reductase MsrA [Gammaproteobacteria bacterium]MBT8055326.1 peptide-methionine (S)-S-oxide reductase MsrA [Gammaproteobacteria bacterium]NNL05501.1 peptide-methionine (S)-S-oxide reductase MsrA [Xanthomonadales bacterium]